MQKTILSDTSCLIVKLLGKNKSVKPLLAKIKQTDFRLSDKLEEQILIKANEI